MLDKTLTRLILDTDNQILAKIADLEKKYGKVRIEYIYKLGMYLLKGIQDKNSVAFLD